MNAEQADLLRRFLAETTPLTPRRVDWSTIQAMHNIGLMRRVDSPIMFEIQFTPAFLNEIQTQLNPV